MADLIPYISNTNTIMVYVRDQVNNDSLQSATLTFALTDTSAVEITSGSMTFDSRQRIKNKNYSLFLGTLAHTLSLTENTPYLLSVTLTHDGKQGYWENIRVNPRKRDIRA